MKDSADIQENIYTYDSNNPEYRTLPNIGNTCFLNSIIQGLFQMHVIRKYLRRYNSSKQNILYFLKMLFIQMSTKTTQQEKTIILQKIQRQLEKITNDYIRGNYYEAYHTFFAILTIILQEDPSLSQYFKVKYTLKCNCQTEAFVCSDLKIDTQLTYCEICGKPFQKKLQEVSQYLIVHEKQGKKGNEELKELISEIIDIVAKIIHVGNKQYGHYYSLCREGGFYKYNDNICTKITRDQYNSELCQFSIYGKVQPMKEEQDNNYSDTYSIGQRVLTIFLIIAHKHHHPRHRVVFNQQETNNHSFSSSRQQRHQKRIQISSAASSLVQQYEKTKNILNRKFNDRHSDYI